ncbi:MAG: electron transfer flavoprotein subunit alpha [Bacteroidia bacterium]|nr:electron transfer flavoprotein subunit alpha [Bacteroidia bacterium]
MKVWIDKDNCSGCEACIDACPYNAIQIVEQIAVINEACNGCGACIDSCAQGYILSDAEKEEIKVFDLNEYKGVWIIAEQRNGVLSKNSLELLCCGQMLGKTLGQEVCAVLPGENVIHLTDELAVYGAKKIYLADDKRLMNYQTNTYTNTISGIIAKYKPNIVLFSATHTGRDLAPRIAQRLKTGLTADCTDLTIEKEEKHLLQTRPAFGGNIMATIISPRTRPQMTTIRPGAMKLITQDKDTRVKAPEIIKWKVQLSEEDIKTKILEIVKERHRHANLQDAKIIIGGGRGIKSKEGVKVLEKLTEAIGGEVGGSRVAVEQGWIPRERQIGQTGLSVSPDLFISCGISGSIQHRAGMQNSKIIIAINRDPDAPIFNIADYGIVGDMFEIVPALTKALKDTDYTDKNTDYTINYG